MLSRPNWTIDKPTCGIDLSRNIHYDSILANKIKQELANHISFHDYPNEYNLYSSISSYYKIPIKQLTIGYGATEIIERIFKILPFDDVYIVEPTFEMVQVYCKLYNKRFHIITLDQLPNISGGALYIANPSGNTGEVIDISEYINNFELCIIDEAYADFYTKYSILHNNYDNVIVIKTLSKSLGTAGFRVGFCKANTTITELLQAVRSNFICTSFSSIIIPRVIANTSEVIDRMLLTKQYLESTYTCKSSKGNYVLFNKSNAYTDKFNAKIVQGYYRMALINLDILTA